MTMETEQTQDVVTNAGTPPAPLRTPVFIDSQPAAQRAILDYFKSLQKDNTVIAAREAARLAPYFATLKAVTEEDLAVPAHRYVKPLEDTLAAPDGLAGLFNTVARRTKNTILSDVVVAPIALVTCKPVRKALLRFPTRYSGYGKDAFIFSFWQDSDKETKSSISIPFIAFDDARMDSAAPHRPETLYKEFQRVMSSGNHDMLHHYGNQLLNSTIAATETTGGQELRTWHSWYFRGTDDRDIEGWESWLMLDHARVRRAMEEGPEGDALKASVDTFFDELARIGGAIAATRGAEEAHRTVDYFGTMLGFALMRFMPMTHPLMQHAIARLEAADPLPALPDKDKEKLYKFIKGNYFMGEAIANYKANGVNIAHGNDYASLKTLQIMSVSPTIARLMGPAQPGSPLAKVQERAGNANRDMLLATVKDMDFVQKEEPTHHWLRRWKNEPGP